MYVTTDTVLKNNKLIKDQILSYSNGFIKNFKVLASGKNDDGLFEIEAEVDVEIGTITNKLTNLNIGMRTLDEGNMSDLFAKASTRLESKDDFKKMFQKIIIDPVIKNKGVFDIKIGKLEVYDKEHKYSVKAAKKDSVAVKIPVYISLNDNYKKSIMQFLDKVSERSEENEIEWSISWNKTGKSLVCIYSIGRNEQFKVEKSYLLSETKSDFFNKGIESLYSGHYLKIMFFDGNKTEYGKLTFKYEGGKDHNFYQKNSNKTDLPKSLFYDIYSNFNYHTKGARPIKIFRTYDSYSYKKINSITFNSSKYNKNIYKVFNIVIFMKKEAISSIKEIKAKIYY